MDFTLIDPPLPSYALFRRLRSFGAKRTILRQMEYDIVSGMSLSGRVLDFGGGRRAEYLKYLNGDAEILSVNIDAEFDPTHIVAPGDPLPFDDAGFDQVITLNTLEHVYDDHGALAELARVLKPGGTLTIIVPFMYPVHGHPDDYNRHTPSWWGETLRRLGFSKASVLPIIFGRATAAQIVGGRGGLLGRRLSVWLAASRDILMARALFAGKTTYSGRRGAKVWASAPGLMITATR
jgi:SAM-dependent methyltransferase